MRPSVLRRTIVDFPCAALKRVRAARSLALTRSPSRTDLVMFGGMLSGAYCRITIAHPPPDRQPDVFVRVEVFVCRCNLRPSMVLIFARDCRLRVRQRYLNTICFFVCFFVVLLCCCVVLWLLCWSGGRGPDARIRTGGIVPIGLCSWTTRTGRN